MAVKLKVWTENNAEKVTLIAEIRHGPGGRWYKSEIDIVEPISPVDLVNALRQLGDEIERNLHIGTGQPVQ